MGIFMQPKGAIIDLDGTIYVGESIVPGAQQGLEFLRSKNIPHVFLTNNGSRSREEMAQFLSDLGLGVTPGEIVTSSSLLALRLSQLSRDPVLCIGGATGLPMSLLEQGLNVTTFAEINGISSLSLAVGWTDRLDFDLLSKLLSVEDRISRVFVTDRDRIYPGEGSEILPGTGWIVGAIESLLDVSAVVSGKPSVGAFESAAEIIGVPIDQVVVIGDSITSDIVPALKANAQAVLLNGPVAKRRISGSSEVSCLTCTDLFEAVQEVFN